MKHHYFLFLSIIMIQPYLLSMNSIIDQTCTIDSKVDLLLDENSILESIVCALVMNLDTIESKLDLLATNSTLSKACSIESIVDLIINNISSISQNISNIDSYQTNILNDGNTIVQNTSSVLSKLCIIDSFIDNIELYITTISSQLDTIYTFNSKVDIIDAAFAMLESKWCTIDSITDSIDSAVDQITDNFSAMQITTLSISSKVDTSISHMLSIQSNITSVNSVVDTLIPDTKAITSKICAIDSFTDIIDSKIDIITTLITHAHDLAIQNAVNFQQTWTVLDAIQQSLNTAQSRADFTSSRLDSLYLIADQSGTYSVINALTTVNRDIISEIDEIQSIMDQINSLPYRPTFTVMDDILSKLSETDSLMDTLATTVTVLTPLENCFGIPLNHSDFNPTTGFTLSTGGRYYLVEDIIFNPSTTGVTMLKIATNNVYIDLNGKTITQGNDQDDCIAIATSGGARNNITIANGAIRKFSFEALDIPATAGVTNMIVQNILIEDTGINSTSVECDGINIKNGGASNNIIFRNVTVSTTRTGDAFDLENVSNILIENCYIFRTNISNVAAGSGFLIQFTSSNIIFRDTVIINTQTNGIMLRTTPNPGIFTNVLIDNCLIENALTNGIQFDQGSNITVKNNTIITSKNHGIFFQDTGDIKRRMIFINNNISNNVVDGIHLEDSATTNNIFLFNILNNNGNININATTVAIGSNNTFLGNSAFNTTNAKNYTNLSTTPKITIQQSKAFPATTPTYWYNISMIP